MADRRRRNWLLKALTQEEYESLQPHLEEVDLPLGTVICESGAELEFAYFPESCVVSIVAVLDDGMTPEMTTIGPEGVVRLAAMLGKPESFGRYIVQLPGRASRIRLDDLQAAALEHPRMRDTMFLYLLGDRSSAPARCVQCCSPRRSPLRAMDTDAPRLPRRGAAPTNS